jgi:hypothetical protein
MQVLEHAISSTGIERVVSEFQRQGVSYRNSGCGNIARVRSIALATKTWFGSIPTTRPAEPTAPRMISASRPSPHPTSSTEPLGCSLSYALALHRSNMNITKISFVNEHQA